MKVGVKFCGHCNMHKNMVVLCQELKARNTDILFAPAAGLSGMDVLLVLNACPVACATRPPFSGPVIVATPTDVDSWPVSPSQLIPELERKLRSACSGQQV